MNKNPEFLSEAIGYIIPYGALHDKAGKTGLMSAFMESFRYGTKSYPDQAKLFAELENTGAILNSSCGYEASFLFISVPKDNADKAKVLLEEIFHNTVLTPENFSKLVTTQEMAIDTENLSDVSNARNKFLEMSTGIGSRLGNKKDLKTITIEDIESVYNIVKTAPVMMRMSSSEVYKIEGQFNHDLLQRLPIVSSESRFLNIPKDVPQKVVIMGYRIKGDLDYDIFKRRVAQYIVSGNWMGLAFERIREKHSAAYFAAGSSTMFKKDGTYGIFAGVSTENVVKSLELMKEIFDDLVKGNFEDKLVEIAKQCLITEIAGISDSLESSFLAIGGQLAKGMEIYSYEEAQESISKVTKEDVSEFFTDVTIGNPFITVLGDIDKLANDRALELIS